MTAGDILFHSQFTFHDGAKGSKLLIVLNEPDLSNDEPYLVIRATSRLKEKQMQAGCLAAWKLFFIPPTEDEYFTKPTLLQLDYIYELNAATVLKDGMQQILKHVGKLSTLTMAQLKNCIKQVKEDISEKHYQLIFRK